MTEREKVFLPEQKRASSEDEYSMPVPSPEYSFDPDAPEVDESFVFENATVTRTTDGTPDIYFTVQRANLDPDARRADRLLTKVNEDEIDDLVEAYVDKTGWSYDDARRHLGLTL